MAQHRHLLWKSCQHLQKHRAFRWRFKAPPGPSWTLAACKACAATSACTVNSGGATEPSAALELERPIFSGKSRDHEIAWKTFACNISTHVILHMLHLKKNMSKDESCERNGHSLCQRELRHPCNSWMKQLASSCICGNNICDSLSWMCVPHLHPFSHKNSGPSARTNNNKKHFLANLWQVQIWTIHHHCQVQAPFCTGFFSSTLFGQSFTLDPQISCHKQLEKPRRARSPQVFKHGILTNISVHLVNPTCSTSI